jgi:hypothetical protein
MTPRILVSLLAIGALAIGGTACRKKVEVAEVLPAQPEPPPPPPEPEPEPAPTCDKRTALKGDWYVSIVVADDVEGPIKGMNAFYRLGVFPQEDPCTAKVLVKLEGWGRGELKYEKNYTGETMIAEPDGSWWDVPMHYGIGEGAEEETEMVMRFRQGGERLEGYWFYTGPSWTRSPIWGTLQGRREPTREAFDPTPNAVDALARCPLKGMDMATKSTCL